MKKPYQGYVIWSWSHNMDYFYGWDADTLDSIDERKSVCALHAQVDQAMEERYPGIVIKRDEDWNCTGPSRASCLYVVGNNAPDSEEEQMILETFECVGSKCYEQYDHWLVQK